MKISMIYVKTKVLVSASDNFSAEEKIFINQQKFKFNTLYEWKFATVNNDWIYFCEGMKRWFVSRADLAMK